MLTIPHKITLHKFEMHKIFFTLILFCCVTINAQTQDTINVTERDSAIINNVYLATETFSCYCTPIDVASLYPGDMEVFYSLFTKNIRKNHLKKAAKYNTRITFIVDKYGMITNIKVINEPNPKIKEEILLAIARGAKLWSPAIKNNIPVETTFDLPVVKNNK